MQNLEIIQIKNSPPETPFAPVYTYSLCEAMISNVDFNTVTKIILQKEKEIIKNNPSYSDGHTSLGPDSLTSRFPSFNVLNWDFDEIKKIKDNIIKTHNIFLDKLNIPKPDEVWIQCWANVMRKGEQIKPHLHNKNADTYLGGHICVKCENTSTHYINPIDQINLPETYTSENKVGKITLFQNNIPHFTDIHNGEEERITIAFDMSLKKDKENYIKII